MGVYAGGATADNLSFARQLSCTHIIQHLPNLDDLPSGRDGVWSADDLRRLHDHMASFELKLEAIENFPAHFWSDILLDGPRRDAQMENLKQTIRNLGTAGIPVMGYYFSLAGVWARVHGPWARGGAQTVGMIADQMPAETPIPRGEVWGMTYDPEAGEGDIGTVSEDEMWARLQWFLEHLVPVAEEAGVRLAAHPDDPPVPTLRGTARLITHPDRYQRLLDLVPSWHNALEFCQGTITEMPGGDPLDAVRRYASQDRVGYVHFRNVRGTAPNYIEVFIDEGDVDMLEAMRAWHESGFDGVMIPDHTPATSCPAPWHAGIAFALGYMRACMTAVERM